MIDTGRACPQDGSLLLSARNRHQYTQHQSWHTSCAYGHWAQAGKEACPMCIVMIDDDEDVRLTMADALADQGYTVVQVASPEQARKALTATSCGLVLSDSFWRGAGDS